MGIHHRAAVEEGVFLHKSPQSSIESSDNSWVLSSITKANEANLRIESSKEAQHK